MAEEEEEETGESVSPMLVWLLVGVLGSECILAGELISNDEEELTCFCCGAVCASAREDGCCSDATRICEK